MTAAAVRRGLAVAFTSLLCGLVAAPSRATKLDLRVTSVDDGDRVLLEEMVDVPVGEEQRFASDGLRLGGRGDLVRAVVYVTVTAATATSVEVAVTGLLQAVHGDNRISWTTRTLTVGRGEVGAFVTTTGSPIRFAIGYGTVGAPVDRPAIDLTTTFRLERRGREGIVELLLERKVRLRGPEPTEVILEDARMLGIMVVRIAPVARDADGAIVAFDIEVPAVEGQGPAQVFRQPAIDLGWDDVVRIAGLTGSEGELTLEIKPER